MDLRVGVAVLIEDGGRVLLGERLHAHGEGSFAPPGGHVDDDESPEMAARREVLEETGLELGSLELSRWTFNRFPEVRRNYVTLFFKASFPGGVVQLLEPDKCSGWDWYPWESLPEKLFPAFKSFVESPN